MNSKVLLIEDDETTNFLNKLVLKSAGIEDVYETLNGLDAVNFIKKNCPDIIFLDINMPVMDGWEFLQEKETQALCMSVKIALLSSSSRPEDRKKAEEYPSVIAYFEKPLTTQKIEDLRQRMAG